MLLGHHLSHLPRQTIAALAAVAAFLKLGLIFRCVDDAAVRARLALAWMCHQLGKVLASTLTAADFGVHGSRWRSVKFYATNEALHQHARFHRSDLEMPVRPILAYSCVVAIFAAVFFAANIGPPNSEVLAAFLAVYVVAIVFACQNPVAMRRMFGGVAWAAQHLDIAFDQFQVRSGRYRKPVVPLEIICRAACLARPDLADDAVDESRSSGLPVSLLFASSQRTDKAVPSAVFCHRFTVSVRPELIAAASAWIFGYNGQAAFSLEGL